MLGRHCIAFLTDHCKTYTKLLVVVKAALCQISGASAGSCVALSLVCHTSLSEVVSNTLAGCAQARRGALGPFSPSFNADRWLREGLQRLLPPNAHKLAR